MIEPDINVLARLKESFSSFGMLGVTAMQNSPIDSKSVITGLIIGLVSAIGTSFMVTDRTATKLEIAQRADAEFRQEVKEYMRHRGDEMTRLHDRLARIETVLNPRVVEGMGAMSGMGGMGNRRQRNNGNNNE
jgi:hypothetical protein